MMGIREINVPVWKVYDVFVKLPKTKKRGRGGRRAALVRPGEEGGAYIEKRRGEKYSLAIALANARDNNRRVGASNCHVHTVAVCSVVGNNIFS